MQNMNEKKKEAVICSTPENICLPEREYANGKNHKFDAKSYWESQRYGFAGLGLILRNERNFRIQLCVAGLTVLAGIIFNISHGDWVALSIVIAIVLISESFNSVMEAICDTVSLEYRVNIKYAKDVSAGAVLVSALVSIFAGIIIFYPYVLKVIGRLLNMNL